MSPSLPERPRQLPAGVDTEKADASFKNGVLTVKIPHSPEAKAKVKRIEVHGGEWRAACAELGIPNEQPFHNLPFKRKRMKRNFAYVCPQCFSAIRRVKKINRMVACYACCRKYSGGLFDARFRLLEQKL